MFLIKKYKKNKKIYKNYVKIYKNYVKNKRKVVCGGAGD